MYDLHDTFDSDDASGLQMNCEELFYGAATVGERGQVVIPAHARAQLGIKPGDKLLIMKHPFHNGLMMSKIEAMQGLLDDLKASLDQVQARVENGEETE